MSSPIPPENIWLVRLECDGADEAKRIDAPDAEEAGEKFMEKLSDNGGLSEVLEGNARNQVELIARHELTGEEVALEVAVDFDPVFTVWWKRGKT